MLFYLLYCAIGECERVGQCIFGRRYGWYHKIIVGSGTTVGIILPVVFGAQAVIKTNIVIVKVRRNENFLKYIELVRSETHKNFKSFQFICFHKNV